MKIIISICVILLTNIISTNGQEAIVSTFATGFLTPLGLDVGPNGNIYVADTYNHRIQKIIRDGSVSTFAGDGQ